LEQSTGTTPSACGSRSLQGRLTTLLLVLVAAPAFAQNPPPLPGPTPEADPTRPGQVKIGPFYLEPQIRIGTITYDTNVFYTSTERTDDVYGSIGPALDLTLPVKGDLELYGTGYASYVYYFDTPELRKWTGGAGGGLRYDPPGLRFVADYLWNRRFERPDLEVDRRLTSDEGTLKGELRIKGYERDRRFGLTLRGHARKIAYDENQDFLGNDPARNLNRDEYLAVAEIDARLTAKTTFLFGGDYQQDRFAEATGRDADSNRAYVGFNLASQTRLGGRAVGGARFFRLKNPVEPIQTRDKTSPYWNVALYWIFSERTRFEVGYTDDINFSAFSVIGDTPTRSDRRAYANFYKALWGASDLRLWARYTFFRTDGTVIVLPGDGSPQAGIREDEGWEGGANLGYTFRRRLRLGVGVEYTRRSSTFDDLGLNGALVGFTVSYTP